MTSWRGSSNGGGWRRSNAQEGKLYERVRKKEMGKERQEKDKKK